MNQQFKMTYEDLGRLEYTRLMWKNLEFRNRLLTHWTDPRHPYRERFLKFRIEIETLLRRPAKNDTKLNQALHKRGLSLRVLVREIPPVFGSFWSESKTK